nr:uncharacterized protein LOC129446135 isoform X4 [Misgurnus anguillicaudatus]
MYIIVEFEEEGTTGPAAKSWYADGYSWWPPYKDIDRILKCVRVMEAPQPDKGWTRHKARILHESASFQNVASNWKKASYTSDINSESEIPEKRSHKRKTFSDFMCSSEDEVQEPQQQKKRKTIHKGSVAPAPKPPAVPKRPKKKDPVAQPPVNKINKSFVNQQNWTRKEQQQTRCQSVPSFKAQVGISQAEHTKDGRNVDLPNTQDETYCVQRHSGDQQERTQNVTSATYQPTPPFSAPVGITQADHHSWSVDPPNTREHTLSVLSPLGNQQERTPNVTSATYQPTSTLSAPVGVSRHHDWSVEPPYTQEHTFSFLRPSGEHQERTQTPVSVSQHHDWSVYPPNTQEHTFSVLRPLGEHHERTQTPVGIIQADHHSWSVDPPNTREHTLSVLSPLGNQQERTPNVTSATYQPTPPFSAPVGITQADHHSWSVDPPNTRGTSGMSPAPFQCTTVERAILETIEKMDMKINHLTSLVQSLLGNRRVVPQMQMDEEEEGGVFPLASIADLDRLEQNLADKGFMQRMVNRLSISGGPNMKKTVWRICSKVFTRDVARQLNWCGRGDKRGIRKTNIGALLIASAMRNPVLLSPTEADAEKIIKDFLRLAPGRV